MFPHQLHSVLDRVAGRNGDDVRTALATRNDQHHGVRQSQPDGPHRIQAFDTAQTEIDQGEVEDREAQRDLDLGQRLNPGDIVAVSAQPVTERTRDVGLVRHHQDAVRRRCGRAHTGTVGRPT